jgi:hypothetical protein
MLAGFACADPCAQASRDLTFSPEAGNVAAIEAAAQEGGTMRRTIFARLDRRAFFNAFALGAGFYAANRLFPGLAVASRASAADAGAPDPSSLQPGQFFWSTEGATEGPVVIIISIPKQLVFVYRNAALIGLSTCSTGKPGYSTPAGLFRVISKFKVHRSSKYGDDMPNTLRLTRKGVALLRPPAASVR